MFDQQFLETAKQWVFDGGVWTLYVGIAFGLSLLAKMALTFVTRRLEIFSQKTNMRADDILVAVLQKTHGWALFIWILFPLMSDFAKEHHFFTTLKFVTILASAIQIAFWGLAGIRGWKDTFLERKMQDDAASATALNLVYMVVQVLFIIVLILMSLSHLGFNVSALLAGLGIGGIAVALATQNILGDLFASLLIVLDKPFMVGDFIVVGSEKGTVERVGLKTTRLRSFTGEELIFANKDLLDSRVRNYKRMIRRRGEQIVGVAYDTTPDQLRKIPDWMKEIVNQEQLLLFDRCNLIRFGASSLDFELAFWILDSDYNKFADIQHNLLIRIFEKLQKEGVSIPFPTTTVFIQNEKSNSAYKAP